MQLGVGMYVGRQAREWLQCEALVSDAHISCSERLPCSIFIIPFISLRAFLLVLSVHCYIDYFEMLHSYSLIKDLPQQGMWSVSYVRIPCITICLHAPVRPSCLSTNANIELADHRNGSEILLFLIRVCARLNLFLSSTDVGHRGPRRKG